MSKLIIMKPPDIKKYNQVLDEDRIKWVEDKKLDPHWKKSFNDAYNHDFITARNLHLSLFPIEKYRLKIFSSAFIQYYSVNIELVDDCNFYKICECYKELISNNVLNPKIQKKYKQILQFELNMFKARGNDSNIYPAMLKYLDFTLEDIIKTRAEIFSLRNTVELLLEHYWFREFVDVISKDGSDINHGEIYNYYHTKYLEARSEKLSYIQLRSVAENDGILNEENFNYSKYIVSEHFKFFKNICYVLVESDYELHRNLSKTQLKLIILNFTKLYKLVYKEEMIDFQHETNLTKTKNKRVKSTRSDDIFSTIQKLKMEGYSKSKILILAKTTYPTIRKYWNINSEENLC